MDSRLQKAAESGSIDELYALIDENPFILENIDAVPFVSTPLHVAATFGKIPFAVELMNLKPSFARKLDTSGYSPLHLAVYNNQDYFVTWMLDIYCDLASVRGRNGITPFHLLVSEGNESLVGQCLQRFPNCIEDVTSNGQNAIHLAIMNDRFEVLQILTGWIQRMSQKNAGLIESSVLNQLDFNWDMPLHLAAIKNNHQAVKLLLECRMILRNEVNGDGLTFLDILKNNTENAAGDGLTFLDIITNNNGNAASENMDLKQVIVKTGCKEAASVPKSKQTSEFLKSPFTFVTYCYTFMRRQRSDTSDEARGVFLIVCALMITATYQTALQPPGGVNQSEDKDPGSVVMKQTFFILIWLSNTIGLCCAVFYTFCLIPLDSLFTRWYFWIGTSLCLSYALAMAVISPHPLVFLSATFAFFLLFGLYLLVEVFAGHWREYLTVSSKPSLSWFWNA